jgi:hypothetical protein
MSLRASCPNYRTVLANQAGRFLLSVNRKPVAWTDPHGAAIEWIADIGSNQ